MTKFQDPPLRLKQGFISPFILSIANLYWFADKRAFIMYAIN